MTKTSGRKPGTAILAGIGVVVVIAVIIGLALSGSDVRSYPPGTPEATAQSFVQALFDEDAELAHSFLSTELQAECRPDDLDLWWVRRSGSAVFDEVRHDGDHAEIELRLRATGSDLEVFPFDPYDYDTRTELELDRIDGEWVITAATWPLAGCDWR